MTGFTVPERIRTLDTDWVLDSIRIGGHFERVAIVIHGAAELAALRRAGQVAAATLQAVGARLRPGITTADVNVWVEDDTARRGAIPSQLGFHGFPATVCTSVNEVVCHGIPSETVTLRDGDIINVDVTSELDGFHGDTSRTFLIGDPPQNARQVTEVARRCLEVGIAAVRPGGRLGDVGAAIVEVATEAGCHLVTEFGGHGIGRHMHMPPHVPHVAKAGTGPRLRPGMTFTIEPMVTLTPPHLVRDADGWTWRTRDGTPTAQFEHTVAVTPTGVEILTVPPADLDAG